MPVPDRAMPRMVTSARKEWPWISSLASPSVVLGSACAASKLNDLVNSHIVSRRPVLYLIPSVLCVCRLSRHCGWRRQ